MNVKADIKYNIDSDNYSLKLWYNRGCGGFFVLREQVDMPDIIEIINEYTKDVALNVKYICYCIEKRVAEICRSDLRVCS